MQPTVKTVPKTTLGNNFDRIMLSEGARSRTWAFMFTKPVTFLEMGERRTRVTLELKVGRYLKDKDGRTDIKTPEVLKPKSEVPLTPYETQRLCRWLREKVPLLESGASQYIPIHSDTDADAVRRFLAGGKTAEILKLIDEQELIADDLRRAIAGRQRVIALQEFKEKLQSGDTEQDWQPWFKANDWLFGTDFVETIKERRIDNHNTTDYLAKAQDGFLDIIELKGPEYRFWAEKKDHDNWIPHSDLIKAITQGLNYAFKLEGEMDSNKAFKDYKVPIAKPRALLIYGRSNDWEQGKFEAQRLLNASLNGIQVMTFDQVLARAERAIGHQVPEPPAVAAVEEYDPFAD